VRTPNDVPPSTPFPVFPSQKRPLIQSLFFHPAYVLFFSDFLLLESLTSPPFSVGILRAPSYPAFVLTAALEPFVLPFTTFLLEVLSGSTFRRLTLALTSPFPPILRFFFFLAFYPGVRQIGGVHFHLFACKAQAKVFTSYCTIS